MANILPKTEARGSLQQIYLEPKVRGISNCKLPKTEVKGSMFYTRLRKRFGIAFLIDVASVVYFAASLVPRPSHIPVFDACSMQKRREKAQSVNDIWQTEGGGIPGPRFCWRSAMMAMSSQLVTGQPLSEAGNCETMILAGSRMPSLPVPLAVAATTRRIQTGPSAILGSTAWQEIIISICQGSGYVCDPLAVVLVLTEQSTGALQCWQWLSQ